jgi:hypothetical protein
MAAVWEFFSGAADIDASELPAANDLREQSPEAATVWQAMVNFVAGGPVTDDELPAAENRAGSEKITPARESKRPRDSAVVTPAASAEESTFEATLNSDAAAKKLTNADLKEYLAGKGEQVPPNAKKDQLLTLARAASTQGATPVPAAPVDAASPKAPEPEAPKAESPKLTWTITRLKSFAEEHKVAYPVTALKLDIYEAIIESTGASPRKSQPIASPKRGASNSLSRNSTKKK